MASLVRRLADRLGCELKKKCGTLSAFDFLETLLIEPQPEMISALEALSANNPDAAGDQAAGAGWA